MKRNIDLTENQQFSGRLPEDFFNLVKYKIGEEIQDHEGRPDIVFGWNYVWCSKSETQAAYDKCHCPCCGRFIMPWYLHKDFDTPMKCPYCHFESDEMLTKHPWGLQDVMISNNSIFD